MKALKLSTLFIILLLGYGLSAQNVYTTKTGKKYHTKSCKYLKYSKKQIALKTAKALGYIACKICKPLQNDTKTKSNLLSLTFKERHKYSSTKKVTAAQCKGKTKSGKRCKRKTKNTNGKCYQH